MSRNSYKEKLIHGTPTFPIAIYEKHFSEDIDILAPLHYHREFELLIATSPSLCINLENTSYTLKKGEGLFINSGLLHVIRAASPQESCFIAVVFDISLLCSEMENIYLKYLQNIIEQTIHVQPKLSEKAAGLVFEIATLFQHAQPGYELLIKARLLEIFFCLIKNSPPAAAPVYSPKRQLVKDVLRYIRENYAKPITLQSIADSVHLSKGYLCRLFSSMADVSPIVYLNRYRIEQSTELLLKSHASISEIALQCGFNHVSYFDKMFLRFIGCTPAQYRKNALKNQDILS